MKTPEEIKRGLECCNTFNACSICPYEHIVDTEHGWACVVIRNADTLAYIQQLERERDAAVEDINEAVMTGCLCYVCSRNEKGHCKAFDHGIFEATVMCGQYEWRGVQEVE